MFKVPDITDQDQVGRPLDDLALVGNIAIEQNESWVDPDASITVSTQAEPPMVTVSAAKGADNITISIGGDFLKKIITLYPSERDWKAYQEFEKQLKVEKPSQ